MTLKILALAITITLFAVPFSHADSACASGNIDFLLNVPCTIGNTEFDFTNNPLLDINITPVTTGSLVGFTISGEEGGSFNFTATPLTGEFTSYSAQCDPGFACYLVDSSEGTVAQDVFGVQSSPGVAQSSFNGNYQTGEAPSATFTFIESDPNVTSVPEGSELAMLGISSIGILGALKRKFLSAS
jgi:hypothetical protein